MIIKIFLNYAGLDIGQSLIFQNGHCLGLETITGTDEMIRATINLFSLMGTFLASQWPSIPQNTTTVGHSKHYPPPRLTMLMLINEHR